MVDADSNQFVIVVDVAILSQHQNCSMKIILWTSACYVETLLSGKHTVEIMLRSLKPKSLFISCDVFPTRFSSL